MMMVSMKWTVKYFLLPSSVSNNTIEYVRSNNELVEQLRGAGIDAVSQPLTGSTIGDNCTTRWQLRSLLELGAMRFYQ